MTLALDTSVAVPLLVTNHEHHAAVVRWWDERPVALAGHAAVETYAVLTRLPGSMRLAPDGAALLLAERFASTLLPDGDRLARFPDLCAEVGIAGGATYDALVALAATSNNARLATRDGRALPTYAAMGATLEVVPPRD